MRATDVVSFLSLYVVLSTAELRSGSAERALCEFYGRWIVELMRELSETCAVRSRESLNTTWTQKSLRFAKRPHVLRLVSVGATTGTVGAVVPVGASEGTTL